MRPCLLTGERVVAGLDLVEDVLVGAAVEGRAAREQDVEDDPAAPDVAALVVVLLEHLGGDVVGGAELLAEFLVLLEGLGGAEVDDHDVVDGARLVEQQVLGLHVAVHDVLRVAVVNCRQHLAHHVRRVALGEALARVDLVEQLAAHAESGELVSEGCLLGDQVEAAQVLEELVQFDDVGVFLGSTTDYQFPQNVDLVDELLRVERVDVGLEDDLDGAHVPRHPVDALAHLPERPIAQPLAHHVRVLEAPLLLRHEQARLQSQLRRRLYAIIPPHA